MSKSNNQKLKLLYLLRIFWEETDEKHSLSLRQITEKLASLDISVERKTLYSDFEELRQFGFDIQQQNAGKSASYFLASRDLELAELKLLSDIINSSRFLSEKKSKTLIAKISKLLSVHEAKEINNAAFSNFRKSPNETVFYNIDSIYRAIQMDRQISFKYYQWSLDKKLNPRHGGKTYVISPYFMIWDNENYYLVAYDTQSEKIKHFRIDKIKSVDIKPNNRDGKFLFEGITPNDYATEHFGMFGGDSYRVQLEADVSLLGVIIERFGRDVNIVPSNNGKTILVQTYVVASDKFFGWLLSMGDKIKIKKPDELSQRMLSYLENIINQYKSSK